MNIEKVDVVGLELPQAGVDRDVQALRAIARKVGMDVGFAPLASLVVGRVLGGNDWSPHEVRPVLWRNLGGLVK
jgi:hypothetical protein